ncbi:MAG TPA: hypothetical protein VFJ65_01230 [Solirubrobacterales bacterium]|nr:hypothetical protein [Solirubrobacterales bacterium]
MLPVGSFVSDAASAAGFLAATIAVCGFLLQAPSALARKEEHEVRTATVIGGLFGFFVSLAILVLGT